MQVFADMPAPSVRDALGHWVVFATIWGEGIVLILVAAGMVMVRVTHHGIFLLDVPTLLGGAALGAAITLALSAMAAWLRLAVSPGIARGALRGTFVALLLGFVLRSRFVPDVVWTGAAISLAVAGGISSWRYWAWSSRAICAPKRRWREPRSRAGDALHSISSPLALQRSVCL